MKKKNGFISTAVVYTFFFVFMMMLLFIINKYSNTRSILNTLKREIKIEIKNSDEKYLAQYLINTYETDFNLYYHDENLENGAKDNSYRYSGANPNNFVCFGSDEEVCPIDNLYRVIGIFDEQVKLIKATILRYYYWSGSLSDTMNDWETSGINNQTLNGIYYINLGNFWTNKIAEPIWQVGGLNYLQSQDNAYNVYNNELGEGKIDKPYEGKIGLMYLSEYAYGSNPVNWTRNLSDYSVASIRNNNWLYLGEEEWTIDSDNSDSINVFYITRNGVVSYSNTNISYAIRPTFYLASYVTVLSGTGTQIDPYRID